MARSNTTDDGQNDAFIREVDEEYRRSQFVGFWSRYGRAVVISVVVLLVALAALLYWREERARATGETGEAFAQALTKIEAGNFAGAAPTLTELAGSDKRGYAALARLMQAGTAVQAGDVPKALTIYRGVAGDTALAKPFRDLATIKAARLEYETLPPATLIERLKPLSVPGDPWFAVAGEMTAIAHLRAGNTARAIPLLVAIVRDPTAPPSTRNRVAQLAVSLGVDQATLAPTALAPAGVAK